MGRGGCPTHHADMQTPGPRLRPATRRSSPTLCLARTALPVAAGASSLLCWHVPLPPWVSMPLMCIFPLGSASVSPLGQFLWKSCEVLGHEGRGAVSKVPCGAGCPPVLLLLSPPGWLHHLAYLRPPLCWELQAYKSLF